MGLIIGVVEGDQIFINDDPLVVLKIDSLEKIQVSFRGQDFVLYHDKSTPIASNVLASVGVPSDAHNRTVMMARIMFEAPRSVRILRRQLYADQKQ